MRPTRLVLVLLALFVVVGCGTAHDLRRVGGLTVHTFHRDNTNVHVVVRGRSAVMIDSGYERNARELDEAMRAAGIDPADVSPIVLSHGHADHAGGARYFQQRYGARVVAGRGDAPMLTTGRNEPLCPTGLIGAIRRSGDEGARYTPTDATLVDDTMNLAPTTGIEGRVVVLPGHTPGSTVVVLGEAAFVGDLFRGGIVGDTAETHFYMCDLDDNRRDIRALLDRIAPAATVFFTGHFGPVARDEVESLAPRR
ncbi:MAG: MBL fold metallo-hydrolase [Polyangiales bacterium]